MQENRVQKSEEKLQKNVWHFVSCGSVAAAFHYCHKHRNRNPAEPLKLFFHVSKGGFNL